MRLLISIKSIIDAISTLKLLKNALTAAPNYYGPPVMAAPNPPKSAQELEVAHHEHTGTKAQVNKCELCVAIAEVPLVGAEGAKLRALDSFDCGNIHAAQKKRDVICCPVYGPTDMNVGTSAYWHGILQPYSAAVKTMETVTQPITHCFAGILRKLTAELTDSYIGTEVSKPNLPAQN